MRKWTTLTLLLLLALAALGVPLAEPAHADSPGTGRAGRAEVRYMEGMIDHHQMALDMAGHCLEKAATEAVRAACQSVVDAQTAEIETLRGWQREWYGIEYAPMPMADLMDLMGMGAESGMEMGHGDHTADPAADMPLMMGMMSGFDRVEGVDYELAWLEAMIDHHDDAVHMSERILPRAQHDDLRALAQQIIDAQTAEIDQYEALIADLGGES